MQIGGKYLTIRCHIQPVFVANWTDEYVHTEADLPIRTTLLHANIHINSISTYPELMNFKSASCHGMVSFLPSTGYNSVRNLHALVVVCN